MLKADDTLSLDIPFAIYVSKDEPQEAVEPPIMSLATPPMSD